MSQGFILGLSAITIWTVLLAVSNRAPGRGPWPPRKGNLFAAAWAWGLTTLVYVGLVQIWGQSPVLPPIIQWGLGLPLAIAGNTGL